MFTTPDAHIVEDKRNEEAVGTVKFEFLVSRTESLVSWSLILPVIGSTVAFADATITSAFLMLGMLHEKEDEIADVLKGTLTPAPSGEITLMVGPDL